MAETTEGDQEGTLLAAGKRNRNRLYCCIFTFFVLEVGFFALAGKCWRNPFILDTSRLGNKQIAHGFTVVSVIWQTVALIVVEHGITDVFSREWSVKQGNIVPGTTDRVSTITSGFLDRFHYWKNASRTFKLASWSSILLLLLTKLTPGTINAVAAPFNFPTKIKVVSLPLNMTDDELSFKAKHAYRIIQSEQIGDTLSGLRLGPDLVVYPVVDPNTLGGDITYTTDIVKFHYECNWKAPISVSLTDFGESITEGDRVWLTRLQKLGPAEVGIQGSSITALSLRPTADVKKDGASAFLIIGGNNTFNNTLTTPPTPFAINLGTLPASVMKDGVGVNLEQRTFIGPLASVLVCDPKSSISFGLATISLDGTLKAKTTPLDFFFGGRSPGSYGEFPKMTADLIFENALRAALLEFPETREQFKNAINEVASGIFMGNSSIDWNTATNVPLANLDDINKNMNKFILSAAKAFIDGNSKPLAPDSGGAYIVPSNIIEIDAKRAGHHLILTTSKWVFILAILIFVATLCLLIALTKDLSTEGSYPFNLLTVFSLLQARDGT